MSHNTQVKQIIANEQAEANLAIDMAIAVIGECSFEWLSKLVDAAESELFKRWHNAQLNQNAEQCQRCGAEMIAVTKCEYGFLNDPVVGHRCPKCGEYVPL
jgi:ribosomal protein S27AE